MHTDFEADMLIEINRSLYVPIAEQLNVFLVGDMPKPEPRLTFPEMRSFREDPEVREIRLGEQHRQGKSQVGHYARVGR